MGRDVTHYRVYVYGLFCCEAWLYDNEHEDWAVRNRYRPHQCTFEEIE